MAPRGRPPSAKTLVDRQLGRNVVHPILPAGEDYVVPNHSGDHSAGTTGTPVNDLDLVNKQYVDAQVSPSEKSWAFKSPSGTTGTFYYGGYYKHSGTASDFVDLELPFGTANMSYAAHFFVVTGAATVDELTIRVTGTSIDDSGTRTASDTDDIVIPDSTAVNSYFETTKKWLGAVMLSVVSGTAKICDYGYSKYWDNSNTDFTVVGIEATWLGGATDTAPDIKLRHQSSTGWTYTGSGATPPSPIASMATDHAPEKRTTSGQNGAWKRTNLSTAVEGSGSEGIIIEVITTSNKAFDLGNVLLRIEQ